MGFALSRILVAVDGSEGSNKALEAGIDLAKKYSAKLIITYVVPTVVYSEYGPPGIDALSTIEEEGKAILEKYLQLATQKGINAETILHKGHPATQIVEASKELKADVIVMGSRGRGLVTSLLLGSVSSHVAHSAKCNVLIIK